MTLLEIQNEVARELSAHSAFTMKEFIKLDFPHRTQEQFINTVCDRYARSVAKASLERAAEKAKTKGLYDYSLERAEYVGTIVDKNSILDESNIVL